MKYIKQFKYKPNTLLRRYHGFIKFGLIDNQSNNIIISDTEAIVMDRTTLMLKVSDLIIKYDLGQKSILYFYLL